ncbi:MAG: 23S rRNA (uracil(1939)-C(5))-methyltransferase RlmD [Chlorobi bacterium]|nr:23S rRNA (uracil(1939)-C(5))-methyltransferase RlmD [Chlorobiota bacterium]
MRRGNILKEIAIEKIVYGGKGLGFLNGKAVLVSGAVPGEIVDVKVKKVKKDYIEGTVFRWIKKADYRTQAFCQHFGTCGGCLWQDIPYEKQLELKYAMVLDAYQHVGKWQDPPIKTTIPSPKDKYFRNKLEYSITQVRDKVVIGFHKRGSWEEVVDIQQCYLQPDISDKIRNGLREVLNREGIPGYNPVTHEGLARSLIIRLTRIGQIMVIVVFKREHHPSIEPVMKFLKTEFPEITSLYYAINPKLNDSLAYGVGFKLVHGTPYIEEELLGLRFRISPQSFFQTNLYQTETLYKTALSFANLQGSELVYDLYCGTGTLSLLASKQAKKVVGIEIVEQAIEKAKENAELNNISNAVFYVGDVRKKINEIIEREGKPDVIITNPARAGMHKDVVKTIASVKPKRIVYVSCNPVTQARDIRMLVDMANYELKVVQPVDMFPHTPHIETVSLLELE